MVPEWLELQTRLYSLQPDIFDRPGKSKKGRGGASNLSDDPEVSKLQRKIAKIEKDVLFEKREAEYLWEEKLDELRKDATFARRPVERQKKPPVEEEEPQSEVNVDADMAALQIDGLEDALGDMFAAEPEESGSILGLPPPDVNATIALRDFGKQTGLTPRRILEETCKARDSSCTIAYQDFSSSSHSNRKAAEVRWSKPQEVPFSLTVESITHKSNAMATFVSMDTLATPTAQQAEGYVSTLLLFILFPQNSKEGKAYLRLPAVWRDLWTEFATLK
jgi:ATP-dependent RNA helicase DHX29